MTRKQYTRKVVSLVARMARDNNNSIGEATRYAKDHVHMAIKECGSYQAAWREIVRIFSPLYSDLK